MTYVLLGLSRLSLTGISATKSCSCSEKRNYAHLNSSASVVALGGGGYSRISIQICTSVEGMVLRWLSQEWCIEITQFWSRIGYHLLGKWPVQSKMRFFTQDSTIETDTQRRLCTITV